MNKGQAIGIVDKIKSTYSDSPQHLEALNILLDIAAQFPGNFNTTGAPMDGTEFYAVGAYQKPMRYKLYKPNSNESKRGIKGRWQEMTEYGGWENTKFVPISWIPHPADKSR